LTIAPVSSPIVEARDCLVPQPLPITRIRRESADVATIELAYASGYGVSAGQFKML